MGRRMAEMNTNPMNRMHWNRIYWAFITRLFREGLGYIKMPRGTSGKMMQLRGLIAERKAL